jgi:hypothetical protein
VCSEPSNLQPYTHDAVLPFACFDMLICLRIPIAAESNANLRIEAISHETFEQSHRSLLFDNFADDEAHSDAFSHARIVLLMSFQAQEVQSKLLQKVR